MSRLYFINVFASRGDEARGDVTLEFRKLHPTLICTESTLKLQRGAMLSFEIHAVPG